MLRRDVGGPKYGGTVPFARCGFASWGVLFRTVSLWQRAVGMGWSSVGTQLILLREQVKLAVTFTCSSDAGLCCRISGKAEEASMERQTLVFVRERETKNTVRFQEEANGKPPVIGTLYVQRWALGEPLPQRLTVTIEAASA